VSQIWNEIISMYHEHLLFIDHARKLLYHQLDTPDGRRSLRAPPFSISQSDPGFKGEFPQKEEAERRISLLLCRFQELISGVHTSHRHPVLASCTKLFPVR